MAEISTFVRTVLPSLPEDVFLKLMQKLSDDGFEELADGALLREEDLVGLLKPVQIRKLVSAWKFGELPRSSC
jgi:hypothetical protein